MNEKTERAFLSINFVQASKIIINETIRFMHPLNAELFLRACK
jgi:hypothetical protein